MTGYVYIVANKPNGSIYTGVTNDIARRAFEHREGRGSQFASRHGCKMLVWYEEHHDIRDAIQREKSIKRYIRAWKVELIEAVNPHWQDLYGELW
jgi:putative endonuclease